MDQRSKDKSQPDYPATSTKIPSTQAHPRDGTALAASNKADKSAQTQRWLKEKPHQEYWNTEARVISGETEGDKSASKK